MCFFRKQLSTVFSWTVNSSITSILCRVTRKMIQQILLSASGFPFWLAALVSRCAAKLRRTKPHLCRECAESSSDSELWCQRASVGSCHGTEFNVRWAVRKKKEKKERQVAESGPPPQTDDALSEFLRLFMTDFLFQRFFPMVLLWFISSQREGTSQTLLLHAGFLPLCLLLFIA